METKVPFSFVPVLLMAVAAPIVHASHTSTCAYVLITECKFAPLPGESVASVTLADSSGVAVSGLACQDLNGNGLCGDAGDLAVWLCGTGMVSPLASIPLYVHALVGTSPPLPADSCAMSTPTTGTITVSFDP